MRKKYILLALLVAMLSLVSCNLDNEGILSKLPHVSPIDHKARVFIGVHDDNFYFISEDGIQKGDASKTETTIVSNSAFNHFYQALGWLSGNNIVYMVDEQEKIDVNNQNFYLIPLDGGGSFKKLNTSGISSNDFVAVTWYQINNQIYLVTKESQASSTATVYSVSVDFEKNTLEFSQVKSISNYVDCINGLIIDNKGNYTLNETNIKFKNTKGEDISIGSSAVSATYSSDGNTMYVVTSDLRIFSGNISSGILTQVADASVSVSEKYLPSFVDSEGKLHFIIYGGTRQPSTLFTYDSSDNKLTSRRTQNNDIRASEIFELKGNVYVLTTQYGLFSLDEV